MNATTTQSVKDQILDALMETETTDFSVNDELLEFIRKVRIKKNPLEAAATDMYEALLDAYKFMRITNQDENGEDSKLMYKMIMAIQKANPSK